MKKYYCLLSCLIISLSLQAQYFNIDYSPSVDKRGSHQYNDYSMSGGIIISPKLGVGVGIGVAGIRSPMFAELRYSDGIYSVVRTGVDGGIKFFGQFRLGWSIDIQKSTISLYSHVLTRHIDSYPNKYTHLSNRNIYYGLGIAFYHNFKQ